MFTSHSHRQEASFLDVLWFGLERLYNEVKAFEREELAKLEDGMKTVVLATSFGSAPNDALITNDFVWLYPSRCIPRGRSTTIPLADLGS